MTTSEIVGICAVIGSATVAAIFHALPPEALGGLYGGALGYLGKAAATK